jgi:tetratricopeptide (TPR) repeat protein
MPPLAENARSPSRPMPLTGTVLGTPRYMAPEQHKGKRADARSDQFSFCVALYFALYKRWPFDGATIALLAIAVIDGRMSDHPQDADVSDTVHKVLMRGLSTNPDARYPSMKALLAALDRRPARRRNIFLASVGIAGVIATGSLLWMRHNRAAAPCPASAAKLAAVWSQSQRDAITHAFTESHLPYADQALKSVLDNVDRRATSWTKMEREVCQASRVRGEQSAALLDRRMLCLDHQRASLSAFLDLLGKGGSDIIQNAVLAEHELPSVDICADIAALMSVSETPRDPAVRSEIEAMVRDLRSGHVLLTSSRFDDALTLAQGVVERARRIKYPPVEAEGLLLEGLVQAQRGEHAKARELMTQASERADAAHADRTNATALIELAFVVGSNLGDAAQAEQLIGRSRAAVERVRNPDDLRAKLESRVADVSFAQGHYPEALASYLKAFEIRRRVAGDDAPDVALDLNRIGTAALRTGDTEQARQYQQLAVAASERALGPDHPQTAEALNNLGKVSATSGDYVSAEQSYRKALEISTKALGPKHAAIAATLAALGEVQLAAQQIPDAITSLNEAIDICSSGKPVTTECHIAKFTLAQALWASGDKEHARSLALDAKTALTAGGASTAASVAAITTWLADTESQGAAPKPAPMP